MNKDIIDRFRSEIPVQNFPFRILPSVRTILSVFVITLMLVKVVLNLIARHTRNGKKAVEDHLQRCFRKATDNNNCVDATYRAFYSLPGPTPFPIRLIGNIFQMFKPGAVTEMMNFAREMAKKYGECYRLILFGEDYVVLNSPPLVQALMSSNDNGHLDKGGIEKMLWPKGLDVLVIFPGAEWKVRRKILNRSFTYKSLQGYNSSFNKHSQKMMLDLEKMFSDGKTHDVADLIHQFVFRVSAAALMGVEMSDSDSALYCTCSNNLIDGAFKRVYRPWLYPQSIFRLHPLSRRQNEEIAKMKSVVLKIIKTNEDNIKKKTNNEDIRETAESESNIADHSTNLVSGNMIEVMLHHGLSEDDIFKEVATFLAISQDATSLSILFALFCLAVNPVQQELCRNEVDAVFKDPEKFKNGNLDFHALSDLKYLERCIHESQRMYPAVMIIRKIETPLKLREDLIVPPGVNAVFVAGVLHRDPKYFPDPDTFEPDRFLPENMKALHPYAFLPFSGGPRSCIGMKLAMIEMKIVLAKILYNFEVSTPDGKDLKITYYGTPKPAKPINFLFKKRK